MHPLLQHAKHGLIEESSVRPKNATYDFELGLWHGPNGPLCDDPDHIPQSKKFDLETGEDQKGQ